MGQEREEAALKVRYDPSADAVLLVFSDAEYHESADGPPGVTFDYDKDGRITAMEVLGASKVLAPGSWSSISSSVAHAAE